MPDILQDFPIKASPARVFRISTHCWAMYLRILRRHFEHGESVPYEDRLDV